MRLNRDLRYQIKALLDAGLLQKDIANQLGITPGGLCRELLRNGGRDKYNPDNADKRVRKLARKAHIPFQVQRQNLGGYGSLDKGRPFAGTSRRF